MGMRRTGRSRRATANKIWPGIDESNFVLSSLFRSKGKNGYDRFGGNCAFSGNTPTAPALSGWSEFGNSTVLKFGASDQPGRDQHCQNSTGANGPHLECLTDGGPV